MQTENTLLNPKIGITTNIKLKIWYGGKSVIEKEERIYDGGKLFIKEGVSKLCYFSITQIIKDYFGDRKGVTLWYRKKCANLNNGLIEYMIDSNPHELLESKDEHGFITIFVDYGTQDEGGDVFHDGRYGDEEEESDEGGGFDDTHLDDWDDLAIADGISEMDSPTGFRPTKLEVWNKKGGKVRSLRTHVVDNIVYDEIEDEDRFESDLFAKEVHVPEDEDLNEDSHEEGSDIGSEEEQDKAPVFNPEVDFKKPIELKKSLKFPSAHVCRKAIRQHAILNGYDYYFLHNNATRISVYCRYRCKCLFKAGRLVKCGCDDPRKCKFKIHCSKLKLEETFQIKSMRLNHTCGFHNANPKVTSEFLAERYIEHFRDEPNMSLKYFRKLILRDIGVDVKYYKAHYARSMALYMIHGSAAEQYQKVWDYAAALMKYNPGSSAFVMVSGIKRPPIVFQRMYVCLQPCKQGFIQGCRHIIGVDGCHLKGVWPGVCLVAVGKDGNNNLFPIAWAVVEVENKDSWAWFLELLTRDLGSVTEDLTWVHENEELTFMSDRQKGLLDAFSKVVPNADIRYCVRHIWANFKLAFAGEAYRQSFWKVARASNKVRFEEGMESIKVLSLDAFKYLDKIPPKHWSRHAFNPKSKSAMLLNNGCESFNNVLREARDKPILTMMEWIRRYVMQRAFEKREGLTKYEGSIMPAAMKQLDVASNIAKNCFETISDVDLFEVDHNNERYVVDLKRRTCGCFRWELSGIPCCHAFKCIMKYRGNPEEYVHKAYSTEAYLLAYSPVFQPMPGIKQWDTTPQPQPNPPGFKKMPGRPSKKKRIKEKGEDEAPKEPPVLRKRKPNKCGNCGNPGHNKTKCKNPKAPPKPPVKRGRPPKKGKMQKKTEEKRQCSG